jgi:CBS domain-containing protein
MGRRIVPDLISNQILSTVTPGSSVLDAARIMAERNIGAVLVAERGHLIGICTERDIAQRVCARSRDPEITLVAEVMTRDPATVGPDETPARALAMMRRIGCRHLPVVSGDAIVGMLSIRDLYAAIHQDLEADLRLRDELFMGTGYGVIG